MADGGIRPLSKRPRWLATAFVMVALASPAGLSQVPSAQAAVYWGNGGAIGAANLDGRVRMHGYFRPDYPTYGQIGAVVVSSDYLYWGGLHGIGRLPLYGPEIAQNLVHTDSVVNDLTVDFDVWVDPTLAGNWFMYNLGNQAT